MATLIVEISDALMRCLDQELASGRFKDSNALVQSLLETAVGDRWREETERKLDEAPNEMDRGDFAPWNKGDAARLGREYLQAKRVAS